MYCEWGSKQIWEKKLGLESPQGRGVRGAEQFEFSVGGESPERDDGVGVQLCLYKNGETPIACFPHPPRTKNDKNTRGKRFRRYQSDPRLLGLRRQSQTHKQRKTTTILDVGTERSFFVTAPGSADCPSGPGPRLFAHSAAGILTRM